MSGTVDTSAKRAVANVGEVPSHAFSDEFLTPANPHIDPLRSFVDALPPELLDPDRQVAFPIAESGATTFGALTLEDFTVLKIREAKGALHSEEAEYGRYGTSITRRLEGQLAELDRGESALVFDSGMAAISTLIDAILPLDPHTRGHLIVGTEGYRQTRNILDRMAKRGMVELTVIPMDEFGNVGEYLKPNTKAVFFETPSNPYLKVIDVRAVRTQVEKAGSDALVVVDHTFASPINQRPLEQGAHLVVPSLTKYIGGRNEVMAGAIIGSRELLAPMAQLRGMVGNILKDGDCIKIEAGLPSLEDRVSRSNYNGAYIADLLARHPDVLEVWYPGHLSHPDFSIAQRQMTGFGGVVTFRLNAKDFNEIAAFTNSFIAAGPAGTFLAPSFGGDKPLISVVTVVSHFSQSPEERAERNIPFDLIRVSVGSGDAMDLNNAFQAGFDALWRMKSLAQ